MSGPPLDPFGTEDPYWERHYGIGWLRRFGSRSGDGGLPTRRRGETLAIIVASGLALVFVVAGLAFIFWVAAILIRLLG